MIKRLNIFGYHHYQLHGYNEDNQFCKVFSNLEHLKCNIKHEDDLSFLLKYLPELSTIKAIYLNMTPIPLKPESTQFEKEVQKLNIIYDVQCDTYNEYGGYVIDERGDAFEYKRYTYKKEIFIWIGKSTNYL